MAKVAALTITLLLGLLGSVACQGGPSTGTGTSQQQTAAAGGLTCFLPGWMQRTLSFLPPCRVQTPPATNPHLPPADVSPNRPPSARELTVGYYNKSGTPYYCPSAEYVVKKTVENAIKQDPRVGPQLVRLFFHDCFVRGCDASVLLKNTSGSSAQTERFGLPNINSLGGFEVIDAAKAELESNACRRKVSCADIVAFAARDASYILSYGAIDFAMPAGRLDGRVSLKEEAEQNLPGPFDSLVDLTRSFVAQGLDSHDVVTLSGAHSFGKARCRFFDNRLPPNQSDMDHGFADGLNVTCKSRGPEFRVDQDPVTPVELDNQYYRNVQGGKVLFTSDAALYSTDAAKMVVDGFAKNAKEWALAFGKAMVKMGEIRDKMTVVSPSDKPEIREKCSFYNGFPN